MVDKEVKESNEDNSELLEAIDKSIKKWENIARSILNGVDNSCPLCEYDKKHSYCPLKDGSCTASRLGCIPEWNNVANSIFQMIQKLQETKQKELDKQKKEEVFYHVGQRFISILGRLTNESILALVSVGECCLISLSDGNRYREPVVVKDATKITEEEFQKISNGSFKLKEDKPNE